MSFLNSSGKNILQGVGGVRPNNGSVVEASGSTAAGSLGTTTVTGNAASSTVTGGRKTVDSFNGGPVVYTLVSGSLPTGFYLNGSTGTVTGSYTVQGINSDGAVYSFTVRATLANGEYTDRAYTISLSVPWLYRQIISTGYMCGGYKNSSLWSNVNRMVFSTETCTNLGDGNVDNFHYKSGACGLSKVWIWTGGPTAFQMRTETKQNSGQSAGGGGNNGTAFNERNYAYVMGEGTGSVKKFNFSNETYNDIGGGWNDHAASVSGQYRGMWWGNSGQTQRVYFPTDNLANIGHSMGAHGQQKGLNAKTGFGYGGNEGMYSAGQYFRKTNIETETGVAQPGKPRGDIGEENYMMGQDFGFMLGEHDPSGQNNRSFRYTYSTDSGYNGGSSMEPKGHDGASSGHCGWRD
jgi:hypothetical protein